MLKLTSPSCLTDFQNLLDWKVQELQESWMIILIEELVKMESSKLWIDGSYYREGGVIFSSCESSTLKPSAWILQWFWVTLYWKVLN